MKLKPCILIIEDDDAILEMVSTALEYAGFNVVQASNGKLGLALVDKLHPALIYLDMHMPVMDGWDFLEIYYAQPGPYIPIIAVSAHTSDPRTIPRVAAFLAKPFDLLRFVNLVNRLLSSYARV
jgi:CheY-like chemotaxis protein